MKPVLAFRRLIRRYGIQTVLVLGAVLILLLLRNHGVFSFRQQQPVPTTAVMQVQYDADVLITNAVVVTMNANRDILNPGWIEINNGVITQIGGGELPKVRAREVIDAKDKIVIPGLVNTHTHTAMTLLRGIDDGDAFSAWLTDVNAYEQNLTPDDVYWGSLLGEIEMVESGTTTFNDMYFDPEATAKAVREVGMRALVRLPVTITDGKLELNQQLLGVANTNLITYSLGPNPVTAYSLDQLHVISGWAAQYNLPVHLHMESDATENAEFQKAYKKLPLGVLQSTGLIDQRLILAHAEFFTDKELQTLAQHPNIGVSFNPKSDYKLTGATAPLARMLELGIPVGLGTDGAASTNTLDIFDHMNFSAFAAGKCSQVTLACKSGYSIDPATIFALGTIGGAKILGLDSQIGSLEVGKQADIVIVDNGSARQAPQYDVYSTLVYTTHGTDVTDVLVNGKIILKDKKILTVNVDEVRARVNAIAGRIKKE